MFVECLILTKSIQYLDIIVDTLCF